MTTPKIAKSTLAYLGVVYNEIIIIQDEISKRSVKILLYEQMHKEQHWKHLHYVNIQHSQKHF